MWETKKLLVDFIKKKTKMFFDSLNPSIASYNRKFWKTVKYLFLDKASYGNKIIDNNTDIVQELNNFFENAMGSLNVQGN